jgi:hypothetical protein
MSQVLHLEFACTSTEMKQAQSLHLQKQLGGGSKWRPSLVLVVVLAGMLLVLYQRVRQDFAAGYVPLVLAATIGLGVLIVLWKRRSRDATPVTTRVDVSETDVTVLGANSKHTWFACRKYGGPQEVALSDEAISFGGRDASGTIPWTSYTHFKETPWSFIVWKQHGSAWTMFPKRAFHSSEDRDRSRDLLARHLQQSRWFLG